MASSGHPALRSRCHRGGRVCDASACSCRPCALQAPWPDRRSSNARASCWPCSLPRGRAPVHRGCTVAAVARMAPCEAELVDHGACCRVSRARPRHAFRDGALAQTPRRRRCAHRAKGRAHESSARRAVVAHGGAVVALLASLSLRAVSTQLIVPDYSLSATSARPQTWVRVVLARERKSAASAKSASGEGRCVRRRRGAQHA